MGSTANSPVPYHLPNDAVWFITGCSSGIGKALSQLIASKPTHRLVATARNPSSLSYLPSSPNILSLPLDVTSQPSVDAAITSTLSAFGRIDVVVNNAGYTLYGDAENAEESEAKACVETGFWGMWRVTKHAMRIMREENGKEGGQRGGVVMNVSSMGGRVGFPGNAFYHAAKFAMEGWTEAVSKEVRGEWNIHFCLIEPGGVQTNYATTSTKHIAPHPAYVAEDTPARVLERYINDPENRKTWARPEDVAETMYRIADAGGKKIPLRVPLGPDAWGMLKAELARAMDELEEIREVSTGVGHKDQLGSIEFLKRLD